MSNDIPIPLLGKSGAVFSRILLKNKKEAAGLQIQKGNILYSVMNTFQMPLQLSAQMKSLHLAIKAVGFNSRTQYKNDLKCLFKSNEIIFPILDDYKGRVFTAINTMPNNSLKFVVCGLIAQSYFEYVFTVSNTKFSSKFNAQIDGKSIEVFYIWHPSPSSGENGISAWELKKILPLSKSLKNFHESN
ncbi:MAG TPA: hypothetical protein EYQ43_08770 [Methyloprofundus sp.]|nr:hypothetical protein [Methyloprofundus sp.]